ncbi:MAG: hypothetical protein J2P39_15030, partial [Candidatus Dormibacteraeota bacterium]|nr:hypothetical protein [Candidatus Dormibacteraeota bacterium]
GMHRLQALVGEARVAADIGMILVTSERVELVQRVSEAHTSIVAALATHDADAAVRAVRAHYKSRSEYWLDAWDRGTRDEVKVEPLGRT